MLLLDELINYFDIEMICWFELSLFNYNGVIVFVSYDCVFICSMVICIVDLDRGIIISYSGNYEIYLEKK